MPHLSDISKQDCCTRVKFQNNWNIPLNVNITLFWWIIKINLLDMNMKRNLAFPWWQNLHEKFLKSILFIINFSSHFSLSPRPLQGGPNSFSRLLGSLHIEQEFSINKHKDNHVAWENLMDYGGKLLFDLTPLLSATATPPRF